MKRIFLGFISLFLSLSVDAFSPEAYVDRFMTYSQWNQQLPEQPDNDFLLFISDSTPLAVKLREKWLYNLARKKDWLTYSNYYQSSNDINLQCFAQLAFFQLGKIEESLNSAQHLWLRGTSLPEGCNELFGQLEQNNYLSEDLITQRLILALGQNNLPLARYLLKHYRQPRLEDEQVLLAIYQKPTRILQLERREFYNYFYLFGLKRLVNLDIEQALVYWHHPKTQELLTATQQQDFLAYLALYKAIRNHNDAEEWFAKVDASNTTNVLLDWQIRYALKRENWPEVEKRICHLPEKDKPCWQYWLARALTARGEGTKANAIYESLAESRNYYGFLASLRLGKSPRFEEEYPSYAREQLLPYQSLIKTIKLLYTNKQELQASRLINDFISELPLEEKTAVIHWLATDLQWYSKAIFLSNREKLDNVLSLRFPVILQSLINHQAQIHRLPPALIYAIIRQESGFNDNAVSTAGALGLMQLMPSTASSVAKHAGIPYLDQRQLFLTAKNIAIGAAYLKQLMQQFNQNLILVTAAYNAGPKQVKRWVYFHPPTQLDIWIETLPWHETRNYLKNIIAFYSVYEYRMRAKPSLPGLMKLSARTLPTRLSGQCSSCIRILSFKHFSINSALGAVA